MSTMKIGRAMGGILLAAAVWAATGRDAGAQQQDSLARAKDFYDNAAYEDALQVIGRLRAQSPPASDNTEVAAYQVFCLVALGRTDQAKKAIEAMVRAEPMYHPSDAEASPRVRTLFDDTRRPLLPQLARQVYAKAKTDFDRKDLPAAAAGFDRAIALIDELAESDDPSLTDLRTLAVGFRDLSKSAAPASSAPAGPATDAPASAPPPMSSPALPPASPPVFPPAIPSAEIAPPVIPTAGGSGSTGPKAASSMPDRTVIYGADYADVRPPVAISRDMPAWKPASSFEAHELMKGTVELVIAEDGTVATATILKSVGPAYDAALLRAAASWKFKPATLNGVAVKYRLAINFQLGG